MLGISVTEILVILLVALLVLKPEEIPILTRRSFQYLRKVRLFFYKSKIEIDSITRQISAESGFNIDNIENSKDLDNVFNDDCAFKKKAHLDNTKTAKRNAD